MSDDVARIGLAVDTSQVERGKVALDAFGRSATPAAQGAAAVENSAKKLRDEFGRTVKATEDAQKSLQGLGNALGGGGGGGATGAGGGGGGGGLNPALGQTAKQAGLARHELINFSRQVQDVGVSLASGQSPFIVAVQQGAQIADIFSSSQGTLRGFGAQIASVITPMRLLVGTTAALGLGLFALERSWKSAALAADDASRAIGTNLNQFRALDNEAKAKGIENFSEAAQRFSADIYDATSGAGRLGELLKANGVQAGSFADTLAHVADLVRNAASNQQRQQILRQAGLPADIQWVRLMQQGGDHVRRIIAEADKFGSAAEQEMIRKAHEFDEAWARAWDNFGKNGRGAVVTIATWLDQLSLKGTELLAKLGGESGLRQIGANLLKAGQGTSTMSTPAAADFYRSVGGNRWRRSPDEGPATVDPEQLKTQIRFAQPRLQMLGTLPTPKAEAKSESRDKSTTKECDHDSDYLRKAA